jgi:hypothetical protein
MSAEFIPEILEVRISREELNALKKLALVLGAMLKMFEMPEVKTETRAMFLTLMAIIHRAEHS